MFYTFVVLGVVFVAATLCTLWKLRPASAILWTLFAVLTLVSLVYRWELPR